MRKTAYCILAAVVALAATARSQEPAGEVPPVGGKNTVEVTVVGMGATKDDALRDAQRKAVEKGAGTYIYSQSQTQDFVLVRDTVLARAAGFVQSYKVKSEKETEDGVWEIEVVAVVSVKGIEDTWGVVTNMLKLMGRPKIMVFVNEKIGRERIDESTVQTRIENMLLKSGFLLVNKEQIKEIDRKDMESAVAEDNPAKMQAIAKRFGAQIFISGSANAEAGEKKDISGLELYTYEAEANIKTYRSDTAQMMSAIPGAATRGVQRVWRSAAKQALDLQAQQIAPKVTEDILRFWMDVMEGRGELKLVVDEISFPQYTKLKKALGEMKEIKQVNATFSNRIAECSIQAEVTAETLAEKLVEVMENQLEITDVTANVIKAKYTGK